MPSHLMEKPGHVMESPGVQKDCRQRGNSTTGRTLRARRLPEQRNRAVGRDQTRGASLGPQICCDAFDLLRYIQVLVAQQLLQPWRRRRYQRPLPTGLRGLAVDTVLQDLISDLGPATLLALLSQVHEGLVTRGHVGLNHVLVQRDGLPDHAHPDTALDSIVISELVGVDARLTHQVEEVHGLPQLPCVGARLDQGAVRLAVGNQPVLRHSVE
mmetsp:Transcript_97516/g.262003  ORF Transcript_97516/g.262003 Transcript_97516/m.262003 type:complete len:213 (-) Transcript_97516:120-758(-)